MKFFVGVSGFSYASWKGSFYPKDLKSEDFLSFYAGKLNSVEINSSFYAPPSAAMKPVLKTTGELPYFRLRKDVYTASEVGKWTEKIREIIKGSEEAYVYLRHDETGENASYAVGLKEKISG